MSHKFGCYAKCMILSLCAFLVLALPAWAEDEELSQFLPGMNAKKNIPPEMIEYSLQLQGLDRIESVKMSMDASLYNGRIDKDKITFKVERPEVNSIAFIEVVLKDAYKKKLKSGDGRSVFPVLLNNKDISVKEMGFAYILLDRRFKGKTVEAYNILKLNGDSRLMLAFLNGIDASIKTWYDGFSLSENTSSLAMAIKNRVADDLKGGY